MHSHLENCAISYSPKICAEQKTLSIKLKQPYPKSENFGIGPVYSHGLYIKT